MMARPIDDCPVLLFDPGPVTVTAEARVACRAGGVTPVELVEAHARGGCFDTGTHRQANAAVLRRGAGPVISVREVGRATIEVLTDLGEPLTIVRLAGSRALPRHTEPRPLLSNGQAEVVR